LYHTEHDTALYCLFLYYFVEIYGWPSTDLDSQYKFLSDVTNTYKWCKQLLIGRFYHRISV
jgi:hypothetical protein